MHLEEGQENKCGKWSRARLETQTQALLQDQALHFDI